jgi:cell division septum initiation protein DivIVA
MKKIKSIKQLQAEKKRIKQQLEQLEKQAQTNWNDLKESLRPANLAADTLNKIIKNKTAENLNDNSILKNSFTYGVTLLAQKFADKVGDKLSKLLHK